MAQELVLIPKSKYEHLLFKTRMECGNGLNKNKEQPSETTEKRDMSSVQIGGNSKRDMSSVQIGGNSKRKLTVKQTFVDIGAKSI